jgi:membrane fusion protein (multidrug efflux system)
MLMAAGILVAVVGSAVAWLHGGRYASTDDAYIQAGKLLVSPDVSGLVSSVNVHEGQVIASSMASN